MRHSYTARLAGTHLHNIHLQQYSYSAADRDEHRALLDRASPLGPPNPACSELQTAQHQTLPTDARTTTLTAVAADAASTTTRPAALGDRSQRRIR